MHPVSSNLRKNGPKTIKIIVLGGSVCMPGVHSSNPLTERSN